MHVEVDGKPIPGWIDPSPIRIVGEEVRWWGSGPGGVGEHSQQLQLDGKHFVVGGGGPDWPGLLFEGEYHLNQGALVLSHRSPGKNSPPSVVNVTFHRTSRSTKTLRSHNAGVLHVVFSPEGKTLASIGKDNCLRIWDSKHGRLTTVIQGKKEAAYGAIAFSPDGKLLAAGCRNGVVELFSPCTERRVAKLKGHASVVHSVAFSPDGKRLAVAGGNGIVQLWDPFHRRVMATIETHRFGVASVAFSPTGKFITLACGTAPIEIWSTESLKKQRTIPPLDPQYGTRSVTISSDGKWLASSGVDGVRLDNWSSGKRVAMIDGHSGGQSSAAFSPDGSLFAAAIYEDIRVFSPESESEFTRLGEHTDWVNTVAFSPDGKTLATGSDDGTIKLWDTSKFRPRSAPAVSVTARTVQSGAIESQQLTFDGNVRNVRSVAFVPDTQTLVIGAEGQPVRQGPIGGIIKLWSLEHKREIATMPQPGVFRFGSYIGERMGGVISVAPSPDGAQLAISSSHGTRLWDFTEKEPIATVYGWTRRRYDERDFGFAEVASVAISPDGKTIASGGLGFVSLWSTTDQKPVKELAPGGEAAVAFSPDGRWIATAEGHNRVRLWDAKTYRQVAVAHAQMGPLYTVAFHPNNQRLITGGEGGAKLWDVLEANGKPFFWERTKLRGYLSRVTSVAWSPDGRLVATASFDGTVRVWDAFDGRELVCLGRMEWVWSVAFSPDGKTLAAGGHLLSPRGPQHFPIRRGIVSIWKITDILKPKVINRQAQTVVRDYLRAVREGDEDAANKSVYFIGPQSQSAVPQLETALKHEKASVREASLIALRRIGPIKETKLPALIRAIDDKSESVRLEAILTLGTLGPAARPAVPHLIQTMARKPASFEADRSYSALRAIVGESETKRIMSRLGK